MLVEPIRSKKKIQAMKHFLKGKNERDYLLFTIGINTGLRIGDVLELKYSDVFTPKGQFRERLELIEEKTGKVKKIKLNDIAKKALKEFVDKESLQGKDYIFGSRKGGHITRVQAYRVLKEAAHQIGIDNFGTHTLRKTWGYWTYKETKNVAMLMEMFNHASQIITLRYTGISQEEKDEIYSLVQL